MLQLHKLPHVKLLQVSDWGVLHTNSGTAQVLSFLFPWLAVSRAANEQLPLLDILFER